MSKSSFIGASGDAGASGWRSPGNGRARFATIVRGAGPAGSPGGDGGGAREGVPKMSVPNPVTVGPVAIGRSRPLALIAGPCVMEPGDMTLHIAGRLRA